VKARSTFEKRRKEQQRKERKVDKAERRRLRKEERALQPDTADGVDPDIAHIVCGPQPPEEEPDGS
jgi:hypothetical protein